MARERANRDLNGLLLDLPQACGTLNIGENTCRRLAEEAGAVVRIGKLYRIRIGKLVEYLETTYSA